MERGFRPPHLTHRGRHERHAPSGRRHEWTPAKLLHDSRQVSDYTIAAALLDDLPKAQWLLGERGYDADRFRDALCAKGIQPFLSGGKSRHEPIISDKRRYRRRSRIEMMFGRLKDWCRVVTRYDRCPTAFFSAVTLAATVIFSL